MPNAGPHNRPAVRALHLEGRTPSGFPSALPGTNASVCPGEDRAAKARPQPTRQRKLKYYRGQPKHLWHAVIFPCPVQ